MLVLPLLALSASADVNNTTLTICRLGKTVDGGGTSGHMRTYSACCRAEPNATTPGHWCCVPESVGWGPATVCVSRELDGAYMSLDAGMYGSFKLLTIQSSGPHKKPTYRAKLQGLVKGPCGGQDFVYEELNATFTTP